MKKIGVITFHKSSNYGAFLQCFALQKVLQNFGFEPSVIDYENPADIERYRLIRFESFRSFVGSILKYPLNKKRYNSFKKALDNNIKLTNYKDEYDIAITGSDQVWNTNLCGGKIDPYFSLEKINAKKKVSYAASIGSEKNVKKYPTEFKKIADTLNHISVREKQAKDVLRTITQKDIFVALDPTLLLEKEYWEKQISNIRTDNRDYIMSYFIGINDKQNQALTKISNRLNTKVLSYSLFPKEKNVLKHCYTDSPFDFLARLRDAKLVITGSFHGVALSIVMRKNFYLLLPKPDKRSRMDNILRLTGLTDRIIESEEELDRICFDDIDYAEPQKKLDKLRTESLKWLKHSIED